MNKKIKEKIAIFIDTSENSGGAYQESLYLIENINNLNNFNIHESDEIKQLVTNLENTLDGKGRVILRPSGTEPLIRLMLEGEDIDHLKTQMKVLRSKVEEIVN